MCAGFAVSLHVSSCLFLFDGNQLSIQRASRNLDLSSVTQACDLTSDVFFSTKKGLVVKACCLGCLDHAGT